MRQLIGAWMMFEHQAALNKVEDAPETMCPNGGPAAGMGIDPTWGAAKRATGKKKKKKIKHPPGRLIDRGSNPESLHPVSKTLVRWNLSVHDVSQNAAVFTYTTCAFGKYHFLLVSYKEGGAWSSRPGVSDSCQTGRRSEGGVAAGIALPPMPSPPSAVGRSGLRPLVSSLRRFRVLSHILSSRTTASRPLPY